jgi:molybdopterin-guanine dinucleotide biosynthesis protein A
MIRGSGPIGVVLAGGHGRRLGGDKAGVELAGRPLAQWVVDALRAVLDEVVVACRLDTQIPPLRGVREAWVEPDGPRGPLAGIVSALREARGRPVIACSLSLPLVSPFAVRALAEADAGRRPAVIPEIDGRLEPLLARWQPSALPILGGMSAGVPVEEAAAAVGPLRLALAGDCGLMRVLGPEDVLRAGALLDARRRVARATA